LRVKRRRRRRCWQWRECLKNSRGLLSISFLVLLPPVLLPRASPPAQSS
jgi:hypothetical protein